MNKQSLKFMTLLALLGLFLVACGGADTPAAEEPAAEEPVAAEEEAMEEEMEEDMAEEEAMEEEMADDVMGAGFMDRAMAGEFDGTTVTMLSVFSGEDEIKLNASIEEFEAATGIDFQYEGTSEFEAIVTTRVEGGDAADIIGFPQPGLLANFARAGYVVDLNDHFSREYMEQQYINSWLDMATFEGADGDIMGGVWHRTNGKSQVWYPKAAWDAAGYDIPTTHAEMLEVMDMIVADGDTPWCIGIESGAATGWTATDWTEEYMLRTTSLENYDAWVRGDLDFDSPEVQAAIQTWSDIWFNDDYVLGGREQIATTFFGDSPTAMFEDPPRCWMHKQGSFITSFFPEGTEPGVDYDFFYLPPVGDEYGRPYLVAGDIYAAFSDRPEVLAFMEYFSRGESLKSWMESGGAISPHRDVDLSWHGDPIEAAVGEAIANATSVRFDASDLMPGEVGAGTFWTGMTSYVNGDADLDTILGEIEASWPAGIEGEDASEIEGEDAMEEGEAMASEFDVNITIWADDTRAPILNDLKADFEAEYGVGLIVEQVADINDQFPIAAPAGEGPDILILAHDRIGGFYASGLLAPMDLGDKADAFSATSLNAFTYEGELVGMPYAVENLGFFYNTDMVADAPTTWDEVIEVGGAMVDSGDVTYAIALTGPTYDAFPLQTAFGGYIFGVNDNGYDPSDVGVDSEGMIAAGDFLATNIEAGYISSSVDWDTAHVQFETGEMPFLMAGPWALDRLRDSGVPYAIAPFPDGGQSFLGVQGFVVNALSDNVLLAQAFLTEFVATDAVMTQLAESGNRPSAFNSVVSDDPDLAAFGEAGADAVPMPAIPEMGSVWGSWGDAFTLIISGEQSAEDALTNGAQQIRDLIGGAAAGMVNVPGSWQAASGACEGDWDPACEGTALTDNGDGTFSGTFDLPAGDYEGKVALDGAWTENYGVDGAADGDNYAFTVEADGSVTFTFDSDSKLLTIDQ